MPSAAAGDNLFIGRGKFYFDRYDSVTGLPTGNRRYIGEVNKGDLSVSVQTAPRYTTSKGASVKIADIVTQQTHTIALDLMEVTTENVALGLLGKTSTLTQAMTAVTGELLCATHLVGDILQTAKRAPGSLVLTGPSTTLTLGTDYEIEDPSLGLIRMLTAGTTVTAAYTPGAVNQSMIAAGATPTIIGKLIYVAADDQYGPKYDLEAWKVKITPNGALALINSGNDYGSFSINGEILDDTSNHPDNPFYRAVLRISLVLSDAALKLADTSNGNTYAVYLLYGELTVEQTASGDPETTTLKLADTSNGNFYVVAMVDGNLTLTETEDDTDAVEYYTLPDRVNGHTFELISVNGDLTAIQTD